jgi:hypothetical protein
VVAKRETNSSSLAPTASLGAGEPGVTQVRVANCSRSRDGWPKLVQSSSSSSSSSSYSYKHGSCQSPSHHTPSSSVLVDYFQSDNSIPLDTADYKSKLHPQCDRPPWSLAQNDSACSQVDRYVTVTSVLWRLVKTSVHSESFFFPWAIYYYFMEIRC